jgi:hypothetical protein
MWEELRIERRHAGRVRGRPFGRLQQDFAAKLHMDIYINIYNVHNVFEYISISARY